MQWLRMKPADINELDEVRLFVEQESRDDQSVSVVDGVEEMADGLTLAPDRTPEQAADAQDQDMADPNDARRRSARPIAKAATRKSTRKAQGDGSPAEANGVGEAG